MLPKSTPEVLMKRSRMSLVMSPVILLATAAACSTSPGTAPDMRSTSSAENTGKPPVVLVHGAFFTRTGWAGTEAALARHGFDRIVSVDMPGRDNDGVDLKSISLQSAADKVCAAAPAAPSIFVGHSQGGAVITQALATCPDKVKALLYVAAVVPANGETAFDKLDMVRDGALGQITNFDPAAGLIEFKPGVLAAGGGVEKTFFQELRAINAGAADAALAAMVPEPLGIGTSKLALDAALFARTPAFYLETRDDQAISAETQREVYEARVLGGASGNDVYTFFTAPIAADPTDATFVVSHAAFLARPDAVARVVENVADRLAK
jgi:pimeloyl-ACP methyl ester carboxylesterase